MDQRPELKELEQYAHTNQWLFLGTQLGLPIDQLDAIKQEHRRVADCSWHMFELYLRISPNPSRRQVIDALQLRSVGEVTKALGYKQAVESGQLDSPSNEIGIRRRGPARPHDTSADPMVRQSGVRSKILCNNNSLACLAVLLIAFGVVMLLGASFIRRKTGKDGLM